MGLAGLRQGTQYLKQSSSGGKFTPFLSWKDGDAKTVTFTTPIEEVAKVKIHNFVKVPDDSDRGFHWATFVCRKDPAFSEESGNTCELCDTVGHKPRELHVAIAVELDPVTKKGSPLVQQLNVTTRPYKREDGTEVEYPQWGLVMQGFKNFFGFLSAYGQKYGGINEVAFDITRMGNDKDTQYPMIPIQGIPLPNLDEFEIPTLEEVIEKLGSEEHYQQVSGIEPGSQTGEYGGSGESTPTTNTESRSKFQELASKLPGGQPETYGDDK